MEWRLHNTGFQRNTRQEFDLRRRIERNSLHSIYYYKHTHLETEWEQENADGRTLCLGAAQYGSNQHQYSIHAAYSLSFQTLPIIQAVAFGVAQQIIASGNWMPVCDTIIGITSWKDTITRIPYFSDKMNLGTQAQQQAQPPSKTRPPLIWTSALLGGHRMWLNCTVWALIKAQPALKWVAVEPPPTKCATSVINFKRSKRWKALLPTPWTEGGFSFPRQRLRILL